MSTRETNKARRTIRFDDRRLCIEDIVDIAAGAAGVELSAAPAFRARIAAGADFLDRLIKEQGALYGVTTGFGDSCDVAVEPALIAELPRHLYTYHGCGLGEAYSLAQTRAVIGERWPRYERVFPALASLARTDHLLLQQDIMPAIPCEGSVGASGDLTPLSYLAAVMCGEGEVWRGGAASRRRSSGRAGIMPLTSAAQGRTWRS